MVHKTRYWQQRRVHASACPKGPDIYYRRGNQVESVKSIKNLVGQKGGSLKKKDSYTTVSARWLLFVWCSLSDGHHTIVRCLPDVPPDIIQRPPDICQTSTTYTSDMYHMPTRHKLYHIYIRCPPDICHIWYMSGVNVVHTKRKVVNELSKPLSPEQL